MAGLTSYRRKLEAGLPSTIGARGSTIFVRQSAFPLAMVARQSVNGTTGESYRLTMRQGGKQFTAQEYHEVEITSEVEQTVEVLLGFGDYVEPPPNLGVSDFIRATQPGPLAYLDSPEATLIAPADKRWRIHVRNISDFRMYIGGTSEQALAGLFPLEIGETFTSETRGDVYACIDPGELAPEVPCSILEELFE